MDERNEHCASFDVWKLPGHKAFAHDGANIRVRVRTGRDTFHLHVDNELTNGRRFGYALPADERLAERQQAVIKFTAACKNECVANPSVVLSRPTRTTLTHLRALQALDGVLVGASQRDIAGVLMGKEVAAAHWSADSALRAQLRAMSQRARALMNGGYQSLVSHKKRHAQGGT